MCMECRGVLCRAEEIKSEKQKEKKHKKEERLHKKEEKKVTKNI